jgi:RNA polymerase sigma-70 factor (ECF subfamily)
MESPDIDKNIILKAKSGNAKAFDAIVAFYQKAIYGHLYRIVNNRNDALDLTQDTFIKVYKNRKMIDPDKSFKAWMYKIATNTAYDWLRKQKRQPQVRAIDDSTEFETIEDNPSYYNIGEINNLDLIQALQALRPDREDILRLYYQQGFTYVEISEILQMPLNTVKTNIARAKSELLKKFTQT